MVMNTLEVQLRVTSDQDLVQKIKSCNEKPDGCSTLNP